MPGLNVQTNVAEAMMAEMAKGVGARYEFSFHDG